MILEPIRANAPRDELLARVRQLEAIVLDDAWIPAAWNLTDIEGAYASALAASPRPLRHEELFNAVYGLRPDGGPETRAAVRAVVTRLRGKLRPFGIEIPKNYNRHVGRGYGFTEASRAIIDALRNGSGA